MNPNIETKKFISIVTPCYNEEQNILNVINQVKLVFQSLPAYEYEHIFIDNASTDGTPQILRDISKKDKNIKIIFNSANYGHIRSPFYGLLQANGQAVILLVADLQDPPEIMKDFISQWEKGSKIVIGIKNKSKENAVMFSIRKLYYLIIRHIAEINHIDNFMGFGLYDKSIIQVLRDIKDPYPYLRGLIAELGFDAYPVYYTQNRRSKGKTKNNFYSLYDIAMLGLVNYSKVPLRLAMFTGFFIAIISFIISMIYVVYKLVHWDQFQLGMGPIVIGMFFLGSIQLITLGFIGEYVGAAFSYVKNRPLVIEKERINF